MGFCRILRPSRETGARLDSSIRSSLSRSASWESVMGTPADCDEKRSAVKLQKLDGIGFCDLARKCKSGEGMLRRFLFRTPPNQELLASCVCRRHAIRHHGTRHRVLPRHEKRHGMLRRALVRHGKRHEKYPGSCHRVLLWHGSCLRKRCRGSCVLPLPRFPDSRQNHVHLRFHGLRRKFLHLRR